MPRAFEQDDVASVGVSQFPMIANDRSIGLLWTWNHPRHRVAIDHIVRDPLGAPSEVGGHQPKAGDVDVELPALIIARHAKECPKDRWGDQLDDVTQEGLRQQVDAEPTQNERAACFAPAVNTAFLSGRARCSGEPSTGLIIRANQ
jgi:hypothetical protein